MELLCMDMCMDLYYNIWTILNGLYLYYWFVMNYIITYTSQYINNQTNKRCYKSIVIHAPRKENDRPRSFGN